MFGHIGENEFISISRLKPDFNKLFLNDSIKKNLSLVIQVWFTEWKSKSYKAADTQYSQ